MADDNPDQNIEDNSEQDEPMAADSELESIIEKGEKPKE